MSREESGAPSKTSQPALSRLAIGVLASAAWMVTSSALIILNKRLLSQGFGFPMALSGLGMAFSSVASYIFCKVLRLVESRRVVSWPTYVRSMLPVGFFMALTLHFGNLVYLHLTVSFIQMLKALTPVITMLALFLAQLETPSRRLILSVSLIALGTLLASLGEGALSLAGVAIMLASEVCEAVRLVMTQVLLVGMQFHPIEGLMYLAPACTFWLVLGVAAVEWPRILETGALRLVMDDWMSFAAAAAMGFAVNSLAYVVIQTASSLTLKVLGTVKNAVVVCLGMALYAEQVSSLQGFGYALSMAAFFWYQRIKTAQIRASASLGDSCPLPPLPALRSHSESHLNKNVVVLAMGAPWSARCVGDLGSADHPKQDV